MKTIVAAILAATLATGTPAKAQYVQYAPPPQEENVLARLSAETVDAMQVINTPWYGERITHIARRILEFGQPAADVVSQTLYQATAQNSQWVPVAQQMSQDINRVIGEIQAQTPSPAMPLFQLFVGPGEHRERRDERFQQDERHGQVPQQPQAAPQQNRPPSQPQSGGAPQQPLQQQPPQQNQPVHQAPTQAVQPKPVQPPSAPQGQAPQGQAPQASREHGRDHPCDDTRDPNCREHH